MLNQLKQEKASNRASPNASVHAGSAQKVDFFADIGKRKIKENSDALLKQLRRGETK